MCACAPYVMALWRRAVCVGMVQLTLVYACINIILPIRAYYTIAFHNAYSWLYNIMLYAWEKAHMYNNIIIIMCFVGYSYVSFT